MGRYSASHQTAAGTNLTILHAMGSAAIRVKLSHLILGSDATPADLAGEFTVALTTSAVSGGTSLTEAPLDPLTVAATAVATGGTYSGEFTYTNIALMIPLNQRATFQWWAAPGFEIFTVASANNGVGIRSVGHGGTPNINATMLWEE